MITAIEDLFAKNFLTRIVTIHLVLSIAILGCAKKPSDDSSSDENIITSARYLYVSSGICYSGIGLTTFNATTSSNNVYRLDLSTGLPVDTGPIADYFSPPAQPGDSPVALVDWDTNHLLILVEATAGDRIEKVEKKSGGTRSNFAAAGLTGVLRSMRKGSDGSIYVSRSSAIEKYDNLGLRKFSSGSTPWVNAPGGSCATSTTLISSLVLTSDNKILYTHAAASQNRVGTISSSGYVNAAHCLSAQAAPVVTAAPTASVYLKEHKQLIVSYGNGTNIEDNNSIYVYTVDESSGVLSDAKKLLDATEATYIFGISAMTFDDYQNHLYVATANGTSTTVQNYNIERFYYNPTAKTLTRIGNMPFATASNDTKCISDMLISN